MKSKLLFRGFDAEFQRCFTILIGARLKKLEIQNGNGNNDVIKIVPPVTLLCFDLFSSNYCIRRPKLSRLTMMILAATKYP